MAKTKREAAITRREFIAGASGVMTGAGLVGFPLLLSKPLGEGDGHAVDAAEKSGEALPIPKYYPLTAWDDLYRHFLYTSALILGSFRDTTHYMSLHRDIWNVCVEHNFFVYGNDLLSRMQELSSEGSLHTTTDIELGRKALAGSMQRYPGGWARIVHEMIAHTPALGVAFLFHEDQKG